MSAKLVEWLEAQLAADEAVARGASPEYAWYTSGRDVEGRRLLNGVEEDAADFDEDVDVFTAATKGHARHIMLHDPAHVLAQISAVREVLDLHDGAYGICDTCSNDEVLARTPCDTVRALAKPYAQRPGYQEASS